MVSRYLELINVKATFHDGRPHKHCVERDNILGTKPLRVQINHIEAEVTDGKICSSSFQTSIKMDYSIRR